MCDTLVAAQTITKDKVNIFAKNSDRKPNEGQYLVSFPAKEHTAGEELQCTYISIPQVEKTHAVLLSQPFWMWGAEMGVNEHGLVIGNEAVFSKVPANKKPALLGMDMLRLALERAVTSQEAVKVIIELLEEFGQGGNCTYTGELFYHNSFLIVDPKEAWVLETIDREWAAYQVHDAYSISNTLTLGEEWDQASAGLTDHAKANKIIRSGQSLNLARDYSDFVMTTFGKGQNRCEITLGAMEKRKGEVTPATMMSILRSHGDKPDVGDGLAVVDVCMHAGFGPIREGGQSTASLVAYLDQSGPIVFGTGTSAPCTSVFKPVWVDAELPDMGPRPTETYNPESLFWAHERLYRLVLGNYTERLAVFQAERDELEADFIQGALALAGAPAVERAAYSAKCFRRAFEAEADWLEKVRRVPEKKSLLKSLHNSAWKKFNKEANLTL